MAAAAAVALVLAPGAARAGSHPFAFVLTEQPGFSVDSRAGTLTRDTTVALHFSPAELHAIAGKCRAQRLMRVREPHPRYDLPVRSMDPSFTWVLEVWMDGAHRRFTWVEWRQGVETPEWHALFAVKNKILSIVTARPEYVNLPPPRELRL